MEYTQASQGRVFVARIDDSEDMIEELKKIIKKENIRAGFVHLMGALCSSKVVLGPEEKQYPPKPVWWEHNNVFEVAGLGVFAWENDEPKIHIHSSFGNYKDTKMGCIREKAEVYLTIEAVIQEVISPNITRKLDDRYNASLLNLK